MSNQKHQLNDSPDKITYSFSKEPRFSEKVYTKPLDKYYDVKQQKTKRVCTFGIGKRPEISMNLQSPNPARYKIESQFQNNDKRKGFSFSIGREEAKAISIFNKNNGLPGPGNYQISKFKNESASHCYMGIKLPSIFNNRKNSSSPGPGSYDLKYTELASISKMENKPSHRFKTLPTENINHHKEVGPAQYKRVDELSPNGRYIISKNKNSKAARFGRDRRKTIMFNNKNPGPGSYKLFSIFGNQ